MTASVLSTVEGRWYHCRPAGGRWYHCLLLARRKLLAPRL